MRRFTRLLTLLFMVCIVGVANAKTEKAHATFAAPTNTSAIWNAADSSFTWKQTSYNQIRNIGLPTGDITMYKKLVVDCEVREGSTFRILVYKGGSNLTLWAKDGVNEFILADTLKTLAPDDYNSYLKECSEICLSGSNAVATGEVKINDIYLETYDNEGVKTYATFAAPSNTSAIWNAADSSFTWKQTSYNQIRNIGLPTGDITMYKKLVVDCEVREGSTFRILVYKGGSNLTLWAKDGVNEFILADTLKTLAPDDYNSYLKECSEICLSGSNAVATGEVKINSIYLETYPENESVEIPDVQYEEDPGKPAGDFVDFTEAFPDLQPRIGLGADEHPIELGNGDVVVGQRTKDVIADLSAYSKLTIVTSPNLKLVLYMNHEIDAKQNAGEYTEDEAGKYVFMDVQANENGIIEVDLTQFEKQDLNAICLPWDNSNKGTVWYLLLTKGEAAPVAQDVTFNFNAANHATSSNNENAGDITADEVNTVDGVTMVITPSEGDVPNRYWSTNNGPQLRMYGGKMTLTAPEGKAITKIEIEKGSKWSENNTFNGEAAAEATWEGNSTNVVLAVAANSQMNKVIVTLADKNEETTTYKEPVKPVIAEGTYYLYNVGGAGYLVGANNWGTRASISKVGGLEVEAVMTPEGKYELKTASLYAGKHLGFNGYVDNGDESNWTITPVEGQEGVYTLTSTGTNVLFWDGGEATTTSVGAMPETAVNAYWKIISSVDRLAQLATASAENPVDATFLISNPNFGRNASNAAWTMDASNQNLSGGTDDNKCAESFHAIFTLSQVLAKAPAGKYELKAQGFYRQDDGVEEDLPVFYANDKSGAFPAKTGAENSMNDASASFTKGEYTIEPFQFSVFEDGQLTIGAKGTATHQWVIFDNFQLTYLTSEIPADEFKPAYEEALAAAQAALANETYASITGDEKAALEKAIADNTTVEETMAAYKAAISALNAATSAFTGAKADYEALATAKTGMKDLSYQYAAADKKAAAEATLAVEATSAADAKEKAAAIEKAYRQYAESNALLEGVEGSKNMTEAITNPNAQEAIADPWAVVLGEGSGGSLGILDGEPLTDGEGNSAYKYFDGGNWGAQAWDVSLQQKIALPAGKYQLTVSGRASADVDLQLFAGEATAKLASIGATGGLFGRGWGDASVEFELAEADSIQIGVRGVTEKQYNWMSFTRFRLIQFPQPVEVAHTWNFTKWSEETVANLKAEAAKGTSEGLWSDQEKADSSAVTKELSLENCYWQVGTSAAEGETLTANGQEIAELKGLLFTNNKARSLAIAVNYGDCTSANGEGFGPYHGPAYLWLGSKNIDYFTIKNVKAGSAISMGVESHKISDARGVQLFVAGEELKDAEGNAVAAPTTYTEQTWAVPAGEGVVDVVVKNTNGCHIYFIDAEIGEAAPEVNPDEAEKEVPEGWENLIANGNMAGDDVSNFFSKEAPAPDPYASTITPGAGKDNSRGIIIKSAEGGSQDWDSQFFIRASKAIPAGTKLHMEFDYKASAAAKVGTQGHGEPGAYVNNDGVGDVNFTTEWQHLEKDFTASGDIQTIAFNMNILRDEAEYYIDNIVFWAEKAPEIEWADIIVNGTMEENDAFNFKSKIYPDGNASDAAFTAGAGKDGSQGIVIESPAKASQAWDTQFWITLPIALEQGTKFKLEFDYKADAAVNADAQYHAAPGDYIGNWVSVGFTTEWQHFEKQAIAPAANDNGNKFQSIAFNLSFDNATNLYFDNVKLFLDKETAATAIKTVNTEVPFIEGAVYDLQGRRVAKPARGLYIINGKKVMVK